MLPAINRCQPCVSRMTKTTEARTQMRDKHLPLWHGWPAARRRLDANLWLEAPDKVLQTILRRPGINVTLGYYVKPKTPEMIAAMDKLEAEIAAHNFQDRERPTPGTMPESVNCHF